MKPIHEQLSTLLMALQSSTSRNDAPCLELIQEKANIILEKVRNLEEKFNEIEKVVK